MASTNPILLFLCAVLSYSPMDFHEVSLKPLDLYYSCLQSIFNILLSPPSHLFLTYVSIKKPILIASAMPPQTKQKGKRRLPQEKPVIVEHLGTKSIPVEAIQKTSPEGDYYNSRDIDPAHVKLIEKSFFDDGVQSAEHPMNVMLEYIESDHSQYDSLPKWCLVGEDGSPKAYYTLLNGQHRYPSR